MGFHIGREHGAGRGTVVKKGKHVMRSKGIAAPGVRRDVVTPTHHQVAA